jgi:hypothetical protein
MCVEPVPDLLQGLIGFELMFLFSLESIGVINDVVGETFVATLYVPVNLGLKSPPISRPSFPS